MVKIANIFPTKRFYQSIISIVLFLICGHFLQPFFVAAKILLVLLIVFIIIDVVLLFRGKLKGERKMADRFSNGDFNDVEYKLSSTYDYPINITFIDELPEQFQARDFKIFYSFGVKETKSFRHKIRPVTRGIYSFGKMRLFASTQLGLLSLRFTEGEKTDVAVYPSFLQLRKTELLAFSHNRNQQTTQKLQRPGNSKEFEQIKEYVIGDDYRKLNWKATARFNKLMVNEYQEERSRHVYQLVDMGRTMKMPFDGMTLLDYSVNASLAVANIILKKQDKTGLLTYSSQVHSVVKSDNRRLQMNKMLETLYAQKTIFNESNLEQVFSVLEKNTQGRSLLIFYTNFESTPGLERQLPILKKLANRHLVLLVTFINTELEALTNTKTKDVEQVYKKALAENHLMNKEFLMDKLLRYGIVHMKVRPDELTLAVINKYLEIKDSGMI